MRVMLMLVMTRVSWKEVSLVLRQCALPTKECSDFNTENARTYRKAVYAIKCSLTTF